MAQHTMLSKPPVSRRMHDIKRVLWIVLFLNIAVALAKYLYGTYTGAASMQADGIHSLFDSAGNIVGLIGIAVASRPADESHPYGHAKFETYASFIIGLLLLLAAFDVGSTAVEKLITQEFGAEVTPVSFIIMVVTLAINIGVTTYERRKGKELRSEVLMADASHTLSDALVSIGVIIGLIFVALGFPMADPIMALIVMLAILYTAYDVFRHSLATLSDRARISEEEILAAVKAIPHVLEAHKVRTRGTEGEVYLDLHVLVSPDMTVQSAHDLSNTVEEVLRAKFKNITEVLVHIEPNDGHVE